MRKLEYRDNYFENPFGNIFQKIYAQGVDTVVSPTLPVDPNLIGPLFEDATSGSISVNLISSTLQVNAGDLVDVDIEITTGEQSIKSFIIYIKYDPTILKIIDKDYIDTVFIDESDISIDETTGNIIIKANLQDSVASLNRTVANIRFTSLIPENTTITIDKDQSQILDEDGTNVFDKNNSLNIQIFADEEIIPTPTTIPSLIPTPTAIITEIPKSDLTDPKGFLSMILGIVVLLSGVWALKISRKSTNENK